MAESGDQRGGVPVARRRDGADHVHVLAVVGVGVLVEGDGDLPVWPQLLPVQGLLTSTAKATATASSGATATIALPFASPVTTGQVHGRDGVPVPPEQVGEDVVALAGRRGHCGRAAADQGERCDGSEEGGGGGGGLRSPGSGIWELRACGG